MPATRTTNLTARADALRAKDVILVLGQLAVVTSTEPDGDVFTSVYVEDVSREGSWVLRFVRSKMVPVAQFGPATDAEFDV